MGDLQGRLLEAVERTGVPGASAALIVRGELTTAQAGVATVGGEAMTPDHQFPIMSLTKAMTAVLAFQLVDEGRLSLDDPIRSLLPNFSLQDGHTADAVTVRHLLGNTSGLPPFHFVDDGDDDGALGRFVETFASDSTTFPPGERFSYCNSGFNLVGAAIESLTGDTFEAALASRLLEPLGLDQTGTASPAPMPVTQHWMLPDAVEPMDAWWRLRSGGPCGAGTVYSTARDVARFSVEAAVRWPQLREPQASFPGPHVESWGLGWAVYGWGAGVCGWDGFAPGGRMFLRVFPQHDAALALLTNGQTGRRVLRALLPGLVRDEFGIVVAPERVKPTDVATSSLGSVVGRYRAGEAVCELEADQDGVRVIGHMGQRVALRPAGTDTFTAESEDEDYPHVSVDGDVLSFFCSAWKKET